MMSLKPSPYLTTHSMGWTEDSIQGDYCERDNSSQQFNICINLLGDYKYSYSPPWVSYLTKKEKLTSDLWTYIENIRSTKSS